MTFLEFYAKHAAGRSFPARNAVNAAFHEMHNDGVIAADTALALERHGYDVDALTADLS